MKRIIYITISVLTLFLRFILPLEAQKVFYIYRNDGAINTFITTQIDSMTYSCIDLDSIAHEEYVVHEVYTRDSIYRIPIEIIDSVGFVTPETVYQPGVIVLEGDIRSYIISRNKLTLIFLSTTPKNLLPKVGDKLVTTKVDDVLTNSFVGQVVEVNSKSDGIEIICDPVDLTDVFVYYYGVIQNTSSPASVKLRSPSDGYFGTDGMRTLSPGKLSRDLLNSHEISVEYHVDDELSFSLDNAKASISLTPTVDYSAFLIVNKDYGTHISVSAITNYTLEEYLALAGTIAVDDDLPLFEKAIPIPEALIDVFFEFGVFANIEATLSTEQTWNQKYRHVFHWEWSSKGRETMKNVNDFKPVSNSHTGKVAINGTVSIGAYGKIGIAFIATSSLDIAQVDLRAEGGISVEGTYVPYKKDEKYAKKCTDLYNQIKDREVGVYWYYGLSAEAELFKWSVSKEIPNFFNFPLNKKGKILGIRLVPLFSDTKLSKDENGTYYAETIVLEDVFTADVGFALINQDNDEDANYSYSIYDYNGPKAEAYASFFNKPVSYKYTVYPLVKYMGMEMLAEPYATIEEANITFKNAEIVDVLKEPMYNGDGDYLFTSYSTKFKYVVFISGSDLIDYVQPIIYDNGTWAYTGGKTTVPGDGLFSVTTSMNYDNASDMNWAIGYSITLKDGTIKYSTNTLQFGGTPENPTITVRDNVNSAKKLLRGRDVGNQNNLPIFGEMSFEKIKWRVE